MGIREIKTLEKEVLDLKERLARLEDKVRTLQHEAPQSTATNGEAVTVAPPTPVKGEPMSRAELIAWMKARGMIAELTPQEKQLAAEWDTLPEEEKEEHIRYMRSLKLDPPLSQIIIDNRR